MSRTFVDRYGPWAVVAGGSQGIGAAFAEELAGRGCDVVVVARDEGVHAVADGIARDHGVRAEGVDLDLGRPDVVSALQAALGVATSGCSCGTPPRRPAAASTPPPRRRSRPPST